MGTGQKTVSGRKGVSNMCILGNQNYLKIDADK